MVETGLTVLEGASVPDLSGISIDYAMFLISEEDFQEAEKYLEWKIEGGEDTERYDAIHSAWKDLQQKRLNVESIRVEIKKPFLEAGRLVDSTAKEIIGRLKPIEEHLKSQVDVFTEARRKRERERREKRQAAVQARVDELAALNRYLDPKVAADMSDEEFEAMKAEALADWEKAKAEEERLAAEKKAEEEARLAAARKAAEAEEEKAEAARKAAEAEEKRLESLRRMRAVQINETAFLLLKPYLAAEHHGTVRKMITAGLTQESATTIRAAMPGGAPDSVWSQLFEVCEVELSIPRTQPEFARETILGMAVILRGMNTSLPGCPEGLPEVISEILAEAASQIEKVVADHEWR